MADPILDELNSVGVKEIYRKEIAENFFRGSALLAYFRANSRVPFRGGTFMQFAYRYAPLIGGAYARGGSFNPTKPQTISGGTLDQKTYYVNITEYLEDIEINNRGEYAYFSLVTADLENAVKTMNAINNVAFYRHGQSSGTNITDSRPTQVNGLSEIINDGVTNSWDGNIFTSYATQVRNGAVGSALNGNIRWLGDQSGNPGQLTYPKLIESHMACRRGLSEPDLGVTNKAGYAFALERMQTQQRFVGQETDPVWGASGIHFQKAFILPDDYCPSAISQYGVNDVNIGNYSTSTFTSGSAPAAASNMPASTLLTVGETFFWLTTPDILFRISDSQLFGYGLKPFIYASFNTRVAAQEFAAINLEAPSPWGNAQLFGFNS